MTKQEFLELIVNVDDSTEITFYNLDNEEGDEIIEVFSLEKIYDGEDEVYINIRKLIS